MNGTSGPPNDPGIAETGEPIAELAQLRETPSGTFLSRIRNSIQRRIFAADAIDFSFMIFFRTIFDYLMLGLQSVAGSEPRKGDPE
jgi:hypothetical protein